MSGRVAPAQRKGVQAQAPAGKADAHQADGGAQATSSMWSRLVLRTASSGSRSCAGCGDTPPTSTPGDADEREADAVAEQVLRMPKLGAARGGDAARGGAGDRKLGAATSPGGPSLPGLRRGGAPLDADSRAFFEPRLGVDLGHVRVHADADAAALARRFDAQAFAHGPDIVFDRGRHQPQTTAGRRLLAHELAHVVLHDRGVIRRVPYHTAGIALDRRNINQTAGASYWEQRTLQTYAVTSDRRMNSDPEERDAVYATLWGMTRPRSVTTQRVMLVPINPRGPATAQAPALLYAFTFDPPATGDPRPRLELRFVASGAAAVAAAGPAAATLPASYQAPNIVYGVINFPAAGTQPEDYWRAHPDEERSLFRWLENNSASAIDQVVTTATEQVVQRRPTITHRSVFHVRASRTGGNLSHVRITLVSEGTIEAAQTVSADYRDRDAVDLEYERLRGRGRGRGDRLGSVTLPATIPADERIPVRYAIQQYFEAGRARNTEVDAIIPVGTGSRSVLYTLRFAGNNDVTATRIGEAGTGTGQIDLARVDVTRVRDFPGAAAATTALRSWWTSRYPHGGALTPEPAAAQGQGQGQAPATPVTAATLIDDMNRLIGAGLVNRTWFSLNYGIEILTGTAMATRLQSIHRVPPDMTTDMIDFDGADLRALEISLQTLTSADLGNLRGVKLGRKTQSITRRDTNRGPVYQPGSSGQYGVAIYDGSERTALYFQTLYMNNMDLFRGGSAGTALPTVTMHILHELGHLTGYHAGIEAAFTAWLGRHRQAAPTTLAASGSGERFPEFWALYHSDPQFLCSRYPQVYAWFAQLAASGTPPAAGASFPAPTCP